MQVASYFGVRDSLNLSSSLISSTRQVTWNFGKETQVSSYLGVGDSQSLSTSLISSTRQVTWNFGKGTYQFRYIISGLGDSQSLSTSLISSARLLMLNLRRGTLISTYLGVGRFTDPLNILDLFISIRDVELKKRNTNLVISQSWRFTKHLTILSDFVSSASGKKVVGHYLRVEE